MLSHVSPHIEIPVCFIFICTFLRLITPVRLRSLSSRRAYALLDSWVLLYFHLLLKHGKKGLSL
jgi:hypothetical protein